QALEKGEDVAVYMPTGHGKSVVYQLVAAMMPIGHVGVVITPLQALADDQVWQRTCAY
ncbi:unnamed protein product, partial [Hapterophycus canaliculatus]